MPPALPPTDDCKCNNKALYLKNYLLNTLLSYNINSDDYKSSNGNNFLWDITGTKDNFKFSNKVKGSIGNCKSLYGSLSLTNDLFSIMDNGESIGYSDIQFGREYSIKSNTINKYLSTSITEKGNAYCSLASTTSMYAVTYESTPTSNWIFKKTKASNVSLNAISWGYERYGTSTGIYKSDNIIKSASNVNFDVGIREQEIDKSGSLIPNFISSGNTHIKSSFVNFVEKPFYYNTSDQIYLSILETTSVILKASTLNYEINPGKIYMMGIKGTNSLWCDEAGKYKGKADNLNNLISKFYPNNIYNQVYNLKSQASKAKIIIQDVMTAPYYNDIKSQKIIYIKQFNIPYVSNTVQYDDISRNNTITPIKTDFTHISFSQSGCGGQFSTIYMNSDLSNI